VSRFLVVEGLIGVGKTTLCRLVAESWNAALVLEPAETNPFLEPFYADPKRYAFPVQMFYLLNRWRQQDRIRQGDLFSPFVVSDYLFAKDRLFAEKTLDPMELELYDRFAGALGERAPTPDLVIYLEAPTDVLLKRIRRRSAPGEQAIDGDYLDDLRERYDRLWAGWTACPLLRVDNRDMNYADDSSSRRRILDLVRTVLDLGPSTGALGGAGPVGSPGSLADREEQPSLFGTTG
jgi:deoxyguanosine kinase